MNQLKQIIWRPWTKDPMTWLWISYGGKGVSFYLFFFYIVYIILAILSSETKWDCRRLQHFLVSLGAPWKVTNSFRAPSSLLIRWRLCFLSLELLWELNDTMHAYFWAQCLVHSLKQLCSERGFLHFQINKIHIHRESGHIISEW